MAGMNAEHINPFLMAGMQVLHDVCQLDAKVGKPTAQEAKFGTDTIVIMIGITGEMKGQVMLAFKNEVACDIASKMCMMQITQMDEISTSAICELGNMMMGNAATVFSTKGIGIDITPPTLCRGDILFSSGVTKNICIPLVYEANKAVEINITVKGE